MLPLVHSCCAVPGCEVVDSTDRRFQISGYDAVRGDGKRREPLVDRRSEDLILGKTPRAKLIANARDLARNVSIAAWMVRRHLDYVAEFDFQGRCEDEGLNDQIEAIIDQQDRAFNCDAAGRHPMWRMLRLTELRAVLDGDCGLLKLADATMQGIEGDRFRDPPFAAQTKKGRWVHGVKVDDAGRALAYAIHSRDDSGTFAFERSVPAANMLFHGYYDRFDQIRGISPVAAAINDFRDVYENIDYAKAKAKVSQLFALSVFRQAADSMGNVGVESVEVSADGSQPTTTDDGEPRYKVDFGRGPILLDLEPGDKAEILESKNPSTEFQAFMQVVIMIALKSLDLPFSFFDESHTNFFGSRGAWLHYERSCQPKRQALIELQDRRTLWQMQLALLDGRLKLKKSQSFGDLAWEHIPRGMPWWKPQDEIRGDLMAISGGLDNPQRVCKDRGKGDFYDNVRLIGKALAFAEKELPAGFRLSFDPGPAPTVIETTNAAGSN